MAAEMVSTKQLLCLVKSYEYLLTLDQTEAEEAVRVHGFRLDNTPFGHAFDQPVPRLVALHCYRSPQNNDRLYTIDEYEGERLLVMGYSDEGIASYVSPVKREGTGSLMRFFNPQSQAHWYYFDKFGGENNPIQPTGDPKIQREGVAGWVWVAPTSLVSRVPHPTRVVK